MKKNLTLVLLTLSAVQAFGNDLTIKNFRFARHNALDFERLVIEFRATEAGAKPGVKINLSDKEAQIQLRGAQLVGGIPENAINDSFKHTSKYFGPLSINTDSPDGNVLLRAFTKKNNSKVDAFWLNEPPRLIVDVFPEDSERSFGREVVGNREFASSGHHKKGHDSAKDSSFSPSKNSEVVCYPANAQVKPSIGFDKRANAKGIVLKVEDLQNNRGIGSDILCFTSTSQVVPNISFQPNEGSVANLFQGSFDEKPRVFIPPGETHAQPKKPVAVEKPMNIHEDQMNQEADEMMGLGMEGDSSRTPTTASQYDDSFNKNNPPPTLGKTLLPPIESASGNVNGGSNQANPATLLPPLK